MFRKICLMALFVSVMTGCTHANVSSVPQMVDGRAVFTYQGRANFGHQLKAADNEMILHCKTYNGGRPIAVERESQDLGYVVSGNSTTGFNAVGNKNQIIRFICEK